MSNVINIYNHLNKDDQKEGFINIEINSVNDELINYANNLIYCNCLEYMESKYIESAIQIIFNKVRLGGSLIFTFNNYRNICNSYLNSILKNDEMIGLLKNKKSILSIESMANIIGKIPGASIHAIQYDPDAIKTSLTIVRSEL